MHIDIFASPHRKEPFLVETSAACSPLDYDSPLAEDRSKVRVSRFTVNSRRTGAAERRIQ
jgi:hypothetical protein